MSDDLSLRELLSDLESRIEHHRERRDFHAGQEDHHRDRRSFHETELEAVLKHHEAVKSAVGAASEYAAASPAAVPPKPAVQEAPPPREEIPLYGDRPMVSRLITRVVKAQPEGKEFGAYGIAAQVNRLYKDELQKPVEARAVSVVLRRLRDQGRVRMVRPGRASHEGLYVRVKV